MGMFDTVWITCPKCKEEIEKQTKLGPCILKDYNITSGKEIHNVPEEILQGLQDEKLYCDCGAEYTARLVRVSRPVYELYLKEEE